MKLTPLSIFFVNFANKICHMHCILPLYNKKFIIINPSAMHMTNFVSKIDKKYT
jgi:hypothetical protein